MSRLQERKQLRREYLTKKLLAVGVTGASSLFCLYLLCATILLLVLCGLAFRTWLHHHVDRWLFLCLMSACIALVTGILAIGAGFFTRYTLRKAAGVPYVPPVSHESLPPEEVLIRGSQQPEVAQSESLLRAASAGATPQQQLLRSADDCRAEQTLPL